MNDSLFLRYVQKDTRYKENSLYELLQIREDIMKNPNASTYERALIQYNIMIRDGRLVVA